MSELRAVVSRLEAERYVLLEDLAPPQRNGIQARSVSVNEKERVEREWKMWRHHVAARKRICHDLWERCTEVLPEEKNRVELWQSLGLEGTL